MKKQLFLLMILIFGGMITPSAAQDDSNAPDLKAEEISNRLIALIKTIKTKEDISPGNIERAMQIKVQFDKKNRQDYGLSGLVKGESKWAYNLSAYPYPSKDNKETDTLNFSFNYLNDDEKSGRDDYAPVCAIDFDSYSKELKNAGFTSEPYYGEHNRLLWWNFSRGAVSVQISANGENNTRPKHQCVSMLTVSVSNLAEPVVVKDEEPPPPPPPLPSPTPPLRVKSDAVETLVGDRIRQIRIRTLLLSLPSKMFSSLPSDRKTSEHIKDFRDFEIKTDGNSVWTEDTAFYEVLNPRSKESLLKVEVVTSLYSADFTKAAIDGKPAGATKEKLLEIDYVAATKAAAQPDSLVKKVEYYTPNKLKPGQGVGQGRGSIERDFNVEGVYQMSDVAGHENRFVLTWHTYRLVDNKSQKLKITVSGAKSELSVAEEILNSAVFEQKSFAVMSSETFKTESINKFGIENIAVPSNMIAEPLEEDTSKNKDLEWTTYRYVWKTLVSNITSDSSLKVKISTTIYNADFYKVADDIPFESRTPDSMILISIIGDLKINNISGDNNVKESKIMNLSGVDGAFGLYRVNNGSFLASWQTYRLLDGKAQIISVTVEGDPNEISKAERIIKSLALSVK